MKKYHYSDGKDTFGPFTIEELKEKEISRETLVWFPEIIEWTPAGALPELNILFTTAPPLSKETIEFSEILIKNNANGATETVSVNRWNEMKKQYGEDKFTILAYFDDKGNKIADTSKPLIGKQGPPKSYLVESILVTLFCCMPFGIAGIVNASKVESRIYAGDIEGAKRASNQARKWNTVGLWSGIAIIILYQMIVLFFSLKVAGE
ncbi:MAG: CD225/dispanin family protein [Bacteroidetes bacterium]|nr:CD225/dispanin family protein [Bacteroidota bacterium]